MSARDSLGLRFRPLPVAIIVATGIAIGPTFAPVADDPWSWWAVAGGFALLARHSRAWVVAALLAAGIALAAPRLAALPAGVTADDRRPDRLVGIVRGPIVKTGHGTGAILDTADTEIWIWTDRALAAGQRIAVTGLVRSARGPLGPAMPDRRAAGGRHELTAHQLEVLGEDPGLRSRTWRWAEATQARWSRRIEEAGGDPRGRAALRGIVVGDRSAIPPDLDERWRAAGIYHVLSVSGLHLAVIAGLVFAVLRRLVAAAPWGGRVRPARWAAPPALVLALAYTLVTGAQLATLRALLVIALVLVAAMLDRPVRLLDAIGTAALVLLAWRPEDLFDPSFQLSFTAALTLALRPAHEGGRGGIRGWLARGVATSAWVIVATAPITAYHFQQVAVGGLLGNLVLTPLLELFALPLALAGLALGDLGTPLVWLATWIVTQVDDVTALLAHVMPIGQIAVAGTLTVAVLVTLSLGLAARARRTRGDVLAWAALCLVWTLARTPPPAGALRVTFLDIGQGDAAVIELPDGEVWLVDAGGHASARDLTAASAPGRAITRLLTAYGHDRIDLAVISHPHPDHYLGLAGITLPIAELWSAAEPELASAHATRGDGARGDGSAPSFREIAAVLEARGTVHVHPPLGTARRQAGVELVVWAPRYQPADGAPVIGAADPVRTVNDNSLVISVHYRGRRIVFAGDLEEEGEALAVAAGLPRADVVKVAHHGSPTSSSPAFVAATRPALAVISCGRGNAFGFPSPAVVERWRAAGADLARTDTAGAITLLVDAAGRLTVERFVVQSTGGGSGARARSLR